MDPANYARVRLSKEVKLCGTMRGARPESGQGHQSVGLSANCQTAFPTQRMRQI